MATPPVQLALGTQADFATAEQGTGWNLADCRPQVSDAYIAYPFQPKPAFLKVKQEYAKILR